MMPPRTVTLDTNVFPAAALIARAREAGLDLAAVTVSRREVAGTSLEDAVAELAMVQESAVWGEFKWGQAVWSGKATGARLGRILKIISNGSYPVKGRGSELTAGQVRQLRDALAFEAHLREARDLFVSNDKKAFINGRRREMLSHEFGTEIMTAGEFEQYLNDLAREPERRGTPKGC